MSEVPHYSFTYRGLEIGNLYGGVVFTVTFLVVVLVVLLAIRRY